MADGTMVIFDLDGTLWDSARPVAASWNEVFHRSDPLLPDLTADDIHSVMGMTMKEISRVLHPDLAENDRERLFSECSRYEVEYLHSHPGELYPGVRETLERLREDGFALAIVSNCQRGYVEAFLGGSGLMAFFADYEEWERTGLSKGENIRLVMERSGAGKAVYVGDTHKDEEAAEQAGIPFIHAAYGFGTAERPAAVIRSITELPDSIRCLVQNGTAGNAMP